MGCNTVYCDVVAAGYLRPIRGMDPRSAEQGLLQILPKIAGLFGARQQIDEEILAACVKIIMKRFPFLGFGELKLAYEMYYAGELEVKGAEMYGGIFNAGNMLKILAAYAIHRRKLIAKYSQITDREQAQLQEEHKAEKHRQFLKSIPDEIEARRPSIESWQDIPSYWFEACIELKIFERPVDSEAVRQMQKRAKAAAVEELKTDFGWGKVSPLNDLPTAFKRRDFAKGFEWRSRNREVVIFMKMYCYEKLFEN